MQQAADHGQHELFLWQKRQSVHIQLYVYIRHGRNWTMSTYSQSDSGTYLHVYGLMLPLQVFILLYGCGEQRVPISHLYQSITIKQMSVKNIQSVHLHASCLKHVITSHSVTTGTCVPCHLTITTCGTYENSDSLTLFALGVSTGNCETAFYHTFAFTDNHSQDKMC